MASVSGLDRHKRIEARDLACAAARLSIKKASQIHYTQGARRWDGIRLDLKAYKGEYPKYGDCSAMATWWLWNGLDHFGVRDVVNGTGWKSGYTGTQRNHGKRVGHRGNWQRGDLLQYGVGSRAHVAMYLGGGMVASFGSEIGPLKLHWNYRSDLVVVRRYI